MVKNVIEAVIYGMAAKMSEIFEDESKNGESKYPIYPDGEEQNVEKPCFFIKYLTGNEKREIGLYNKFYKRTLNFVIIGYTLDGDETILHEMLEGLYELEYITATDGTLLRATNLHPEIDDGILHFLIDYEIFIKKDSDTTEKMSNYDFKGELKHEN